MKRARIWFTASLTLLLLISACDLPVEPDEEGCLSLSCSPFYDGWYYDGYDYVWYFDLYLSECSGVSEIHLLALNLEVEDEYGNQLYFYPGTCDYIKEIFGSGDCWLGPGEDWVSSVTFRWSNPWTKYVKFTISGVDDCGHQRRAAATFQACE